MKIDNMVISQFLIGFSLLLISLTTEQSNDILQKCSLFIGILSIVSGSVWAFVNGKRNKDPV
ncbi:hypothetical protein P4U24_01010 [Aeribacillus composti]|uniref:hypothetical protein n=1 Tax=Aeribacillus composti TaxID=1868734 RepID=UPI002E207C95|nr:hypothetical protein [Aeribacillus composti]